MDKLVIYVQEEYGYRDWLWIPDMTLEEVKAWWLELPSVAPYFFGGPVTFPGDVHQIAFHDAKEFQFVTEGEGRVAYPLHEDHLILPDDCASMHIHEDFDSHLSIGGETFYHKGYVPWEEYIKESNELE